MYESIPMELRERLQWVCAADDKIPLNPRTGQPASVIDPGSWGSFVEACNSGKKHIGFVLTSHDPYCIIDLDNKPDKPLTADEWKVHERILTQFDSYTERSASGRGFHIVCRARLEHGRRRDNVEVYAGSRYMIFTGDVVRNTPIVDCQALVETLISQMPFADADSQALTQVDGDLTDLEIHEAAMRAVNADKYDALCKGLWQEMGYPSQSEADFALLSIIAFYTKDNAQVRRLFRYSALGRREKAMRDDKYIDRALRKIRSVQGATTIDLDQVAADAQAMIEKANAARDISARAPAPPPVPAPARVGDSTAAPKPPASPRRHSGEYDYPFPGGLVGEMADYIYRTSNRPVKAVSLLASIGLLSGIVGRSYNISGTGLNQYLMLLATTGIGKEDGSKGIERLINAVRPSVPMADEFIGPAAFASGQALIKTLDAKPCFLSILGEFGHTVKMLNDPRAPAAVTLLKKVLLDLYSKSGWHNVLRSTAYSDSEKNTQMVQAPCVTLLGDATPETFFDNISNADIADGLIPRIHILEYTGGRPPRNRRAHAPPEPALIARLGDAMAIALTMANNKSCANVQIDTEALRILDAFDEECDQKIRSAQFSGAAQLWNRAHLKALKLSGLLAVGVDMHNPVVRAAEASWAIDFTVACTTGVLKRFDSGDVGTGENKQVAEVVRLVDEYFVLTATLRKTYEVEDVLFKAGLIPWRYFWKRGSQLSAFSGSRNGAARAMEEALNTLVEMELLGVVDKPQAFQKYKKRQRLYFRTNDWNVKLP